MSVPWKWGAMIRNGYLELSIPLFSRSTKNGGHITHSATMVNVAPIAPIVPMYWVFGRRNFEGYVEAWRERHDEVEQFRTTMGDNATVQYA